MSFTLCSGFSNVMMFSVSNSSALGMDFWTSGWGWLDILHVYNKCAFFEVSALQWADMKSATSFANSLRNSYVMHQWH